MSLLSQTIQEYLNDNHPKWQATSNKIDGMVYLDHMEDRRFSSILISAQSTSIHAWIYADAIYADTHYVSEYYTDLTLLPQITKIINMIGES